MHCGSRFQNRLRLSASHTMNSLCFRHIEKSSQVIPFGAPQWYFVGSRCFSEQFVDEVWEARKLEEDWECDQPPMKRPQPPVLDWEHPPSDKVLDIADRLLGLNMIDLHEYMKLFKKRTEFRGNIEFILIPKHAKRANGDQAAKEQKDIPVVEKTAFDVKLVSFDPSSKIKVIKEVRTITGLGLKEAKEMVEGVPKLLKKDLTKEEAEQLVKKLNEVGGVCSMD